MKLSRRQPWLDLSFCIFAKFFFFCFLQVLCPRCEVGNASSPKRKAKKGKESPKSNKKKTSRISSLSDVEKVLSETKDSTSTVRT